MTDENKETSNSSPSKGRTSTARKATGTSRRTAGSGGAQAKSTAAKAKATAGGAKSTAAKAKTAAANAKDSAADSASEAGGITQRAGQAAVSGLQSGRQVVTANVARVGSAATTAWTVIKLRKAIATGAAVGVVGLAGVAFATGRATAKPRTGPLTRLANGRI
ncbi:hypothetical protein [Streptomyces sp. SID9727]|uniref:hypothetical protein n=1 Tax=Streptomyces sp. SID9727 TaxID=2706114 RepID=UPI0013C84DFB|nr:hypothetical protein [Streptomyces sp. SID9727]NEC66397.1 hypothetical protein [Streptomyces sp. SID9727]